MWRGLVRIGGKVSGSVTGNGQEFVVDGIGITVGGAGWCGDTRRSRALLDRLGVEYAYYDVDDNGAARAWVVAQNEGRQRLPTILIGATGRVLIEPSDDELAAAVQDAGMTVGP